MLALEKGGGEMNITIFGSGYVGLVAAACLADVGHHILCMDVDPQRIQALNKGETPIFEPGLAELIAANTAAGRLQFSNDIPHAVDLRHPC